MIKPQIGSSGDRAIGSSKTRWQTGVRSPDDPITRFGFALRLGRVLLFLFACGFEQVLQLRHEFLHVFEIEIDGGEPYVRDLVITAQAVHDELTDFAGLALALGGLDDEGLGFIDDLLEFADGYRALLAGAHEAVEHFLPVETLAASVFLYHHVRNFVDALVGGEALFALQAFAAAANGIRFLALARIHDFVIFKPAKGAFHALGCTQEINDCSRRFGTGRWDRESEMVSSRVALTTTDQC